MALNNKFLLTVEDLMTAKKEIVLMFEQQMAFTMFIYTSLAVIILLTAMVTICSFIQQFITYIKWTQPRGITTKGVYEQLSTN